MVFWSICFSLDSVMVLVCCSANFLMTLAFCPVSVFFTVPNWSQPHNVICLGLQVHEVFNDNDNRGSDNSNVFKAWDVALIQISKSRPIQAHSKKSYDHLNTFAVLFPSMQWSGVDTISNVTAARTYFEWSVWYAQTKRALSSFDNVLALIIPLHTGIALGTSGAEMVAAKLRREALVFYLQMCSLICWV